MRILDSMTRRQALGSLAAASVAVGSAACTPNSGGNRPGEPGPTTDGRTGVTLPTYQKRVGAEPDLPGTADGVPDAFFSFPREPKPVSSAVPGSGGTVTALMPVAAPLPADLDKNAWWQGLNERLGVTLDITMGQDYPAKVATVLAGQDLPDLFHLPPDTPRLPDALEANFEDLTEHLAGDAVLDYPNLASLPPYMWETTVYRGAIRAVPPGNVVAAPTWLARQDILDSVGVSTSDATDEESLIDLFKEVTDPRTNQYAIGAAYYLVDLLTTVYRAPNQWSESSGRFTHMYETDEFKAGLEFARRLVAEEVVHPDAFGSISATSLFKGGKLVFQAWGGVGYRGLLREGIPNFKLGILTVPGADGGVGAQRLGTGTFRLCTIAKQDSPDRVRELLRILDYLATPFGSEEYLYQKFGTEGTHFTWDDELEVPIATDQLNGERMNVSYLASQPYELFDPGFSEVTKVVHDHFSTVVPEGFRDPAASLYSESFDKQMSTLTTNATDIINQILQGRVEVSAWDAAVDEWRSGGGDTIRGEFEASFAELNEES